MNLDIMKMFVGAETIFKYRRIARKRSHYHAAKRMRKDGFGVAAALAVLTGRVI